MLKIKSYVKAESIQQAYELNQKRTAVILGGMVWLKMGNRRVSTAIDLSGLDLCGIQENQEEFVIGCMTPLHDLEVHPGLLAYTDGAIKECLRHIVGVQFRNCATVGGSIWGRYGFSDVLTLFLAMDTWVELYKGGRIPLLEFVSMEKDRDILLHLIIKKRKIAICYLSQRNTQTDFPVLTCCASLAGEEVRTVVGARPGKALVLQDPEGFLKGFSAMEQENRKEAIHRYSAWTEQNVPTGSNMRGSAEYRTHLVQVLTRRAWTGIGGTVNENGFLA
nr:FAD binding domain-containing protein [uncultured Blautia sp.]